MIVRRARLRRALAVAAVGLAAVVLPGVALIAPALSPRALWPLAILAISGGFSELLARIGYPRIASWCLLLGGLAVVTTVSLRTSRVLPPQAIATNPSLEWLLLALSVGGALFLIRPVGASRVSAAIGDASNGVSDTADSRNPLPIVHEPAKRQQGVSRAEPITQQDASSAAVGGGPQPGAQPVASGPASAAGAETSGLVPGHGERVLFVDDEEAIVDVMVKMLRGIGFACEGFTSPLEALQAFRTTPHAFDAVVTDFSMPMMTGTLLARELQRIRPGIPVVVLSGFTADEIATGSGTGVDYVIPKPVSIVELSHALATMLGRPVVTSVASPP